MSERINLHQLTRKCETNLKQRMLNTIFVKSEYALLRLCKVDQKANEIFFLWTKLILELQEKSQDKINKNMEVGNE